MPPKDQVKTDATEADATEAEYQNASTSTATVTVACKIPNGLHLDLDGRRITLNGSSSSQIAGGFGLSEDVDKAFFDEWVKRYRDSPAVTGGIVFAYENAADTKARAAEYANLKTGLEPLDPKNPAPGLTADDGK